MARWGQAWGPAGCRGQAERQILSRGFSALSPCNWKWVAQTPCQCGFGDVGAVWAMADRLIAHPSRPRGSSARECFLRNAPTQLASWVDSRRVSARLAPQALRSAPSRLGLRPDKRQRCLGPGDRRRRRYYVDHRRSCRGRVRIPVAAWSASGSADCPRALHRVPRVRTRKPGTALARRIPAARAHPFATSGLARILHQQQHHRASVEIHPGRRAAYAI